MAAEYRKPFILFRPGFILLCLYVAAYAWLRSAGQIDMQAISLPSLRGTDIFRMIGPNPDMPHWRQQLWRALFSLPMVVEEEARKHEQTARKVYDEALGLVARNERPLREADYVIDRPPQFQQQQPQRRQQQQRQYPVSRPPQTYPRLNEGERLIYMPTPEEQRQQQLLFRSAQ
ncbi:MAG: hypothetical protein LBS30_07605 [Planctomycetota bacterium]|jgi:hypothetical protein|nr:hypothetical protein [Planctomycetota bacterium]